MVDDGNAAVNRDAEEAKVDEASTQPDTVEAADDEQHGIPWLGGGTCRKCGKDVTNELVQAEDGEIVTCGHCTKLVPRPSPPTATSEEDAAEPAGHAKVIEVSKEADVFEVYAVLGLEGREPIYIGTDSLSEFTGHGSKWIRGNPDKVVGKLGSVLVGREVPLMRRPDAAQEMLDIKALLAEFEAEAEPRASPWKTPCRCGAWVEKDGLALWHQGLARALACGSCRPEIATALPTKPDKTTSAKKRAKAREAEQELVYLDVRLSERTDADDANRFASAVAGEIHYVVDSTVKGGPWAVWSRTHWLRKNDIPVRRRLLLFWNHGRNEAGRAAAEAARAKKGAEADAWSGFRDHCASRLNRRGNEPLLVLLPSYSALEVAESSFDGPATSMLLNVQNGTIELDTGTLREHRREDYLTRRLELDFDPEAQCPRWDQFLIEVFDGDRDMVAFAGRMFGYALTGSTREEKFFLFFQPEGGGGKGTMLHTVHQLLGPYAKNLEPSSLEKDCKETIRSDLKRLESARFALVNELEQGTSLAESLVKKLASGDLITARNRYQDESEFRSSAKGFMPSNYLPYIQGRDPAIWDRLVVVPFSRKFRGTDAQDKDLGEKLEEELPGILAWAVRGAVAWHAEGLRPPKAVMDATADFRRQQDCFAGWIAERCEFVKGYWTATEELHDDHDVWAARVSVVGCGKREFAYRLARVPGIEAARGYVNRRQVRGWRGIRLRSEGAGSGPVPVL